MTETLSSPRYWLPVPEAVPRKLTTVVAALAVKFRAKDPHCEPVPVGVKVNVCEVEPALARTDLVPPLRFEGRI